MPFHCIVPRSTVDDPTDPDAAPDRATPGVYGHGLLGTGDQVNNGYVERFANEHNFAFCATDWIGMATEDLPNIALILSDFSHFPTLPDRGQQGFVGFELLALLMRHEDGFLSHEAFQSADGTPLWDPEPHGVTYYGNSQGGIKGGALMAMSKQMARGALGVPGMNYSTLLDRSTGWDLPYEIGTTFHGEDRLDWQIRFSLIQMLWDRSEANGYAHVIGKPASYRLDGRPALRGNTVLSHVAFGDHQVSMTTAEVMARTMGAPTHSGTITSGRHHDEQPYWGIEPIDYASHDGSAMMVWDAGNDIPPTANIPPARTDSYRDPHGIPRVDPAAMRQMAVFLRTGRVANVCGDGPCLTEERVDD